MIKIFLTVRNRLEVTKKCIESIYKHTKSDFQLYVYDNISTYKIDEHFLYFGKLYKKGLISQITFNTIDSTFNAFSKAIACNQFGKLHEEDPNKDSISFLCFIDNDMIVTPGWDTIIYQAMRNEKNKDVKVFTQFPGGITDYKKHELLPDCDCYIGQRGGSGFWNVRNNFFRDVGYLDLNKLVGHNKKHDQNYWVLLNKSSNNNPYIVGIDHVFAYHLDGTGIISSVCNKLEGKNKNKPEAEKMKSIEFEKEEERIASFDFNEFYEMVRKNGGGTKW